MKHRIMKLKEAFVPPFFENPEVKRGGIKTTLPCSALEFRHGDITLILVMTSILPAARSWQRAQHPRRGAGMANIWVSSHTPPPNSN